MSIALDIMVFVIIGVTAFIGYKLGFVRYAIKLLGTIACVVVALIVSDMLAPPVFNNIVAPKVESAVLGKLGSFDITSEVKSVLGDLGMGVSLDDKQIRKALSDPGSLPSAFERAALNSGAPQDKAEELKKKAESYFDQDLGTTIAQYAGFDDYEAVGERMQLTSGKAYDLVRAFAKDDGNASGVHYLVYNVFDGVLTSVIRYVIFTVILIILEIAMAVIFRVAGVLDHLPALSGANKTLGLMAGILKGVLYVCLIAGICAAVVKSDSIMDPQTFDDSVIFGFFFRVFY